MPGRNSNVAQESLLHTHVQVRTSDHDDTSPEPKRRSSSRRKSKRLSRDANVKDPFYTAASCPEGTHPALYFEAKYYGPCPDIPTESNCPAQVNVVGLLRAKKESGDQVRCNLYFNERGITVITREKQPVPIISWKTMDVASCATVKHPNKSGRRIGFLKVRDPHTDILSWHLFKYCCGKKDNLSDCFRYVVDCSLRDIGRAVASRAQADLQRRRESLAAPPGMQHDAWSEHELPPPPRYEAPQQSARRRLKFDHITSDEDEAEAEAADIARGVARLSLSPMEFSCIDKSGDETIVADSTYMYIE